MKNTLNLDCRIIFAVICFILCLIPRGINGAPAYPDPVEYQLPDGSVITVLLKGDEFVNWRETEDGYTMLSDSEGFLEYAEDDGEGGMKLSGIRASNEYRRTDKEREFLRNQKKGLRFSRSQIDAIGEVRRTREQFYRDLNLSSMTDDAEISAAPIIGEVRLPIILVSFKDKDFTKAKTDFEMLFDQENYTQTGLPGSLRDYFNATSFGKLNLRVDVWGPYKLPKGIASYAANVNNNGASGNPAEMAAAAVDSAYKNGANFADYADPNSSSNALAVHIIYAGYGEEAGAPTNQSIWAHASSFPVKMLNGKRVSTYSCSAELRDNRGTNLTNIGVVAHELGHSLLKLPDYYDTDYGSSGGQSVDMGSWELMAGGNWNYGSSGSAGSSPALLSAYSRVVCGWEEEMLINNPGNITIPSPVYPAAEKTDIYRINTTTNNEYFLLENRQKTGWDAGIPGSGLLIYKVNKNANGGWGTGIGRNNVNCVPTDRGYYVMQANCTNTNGCSQSRSTDPFPQTGKDSFTDTSTPNAKSKAGANTNRPITNITHNTTARTISFEVGGPGVVISEYTVTFNTDGGSYVAPQNVEIGKTATRPASNPTKNGYTFDDWYSNSQKTILFNFSSAITANTTVYAKWTENPKYTVTLNPNGIGASVNPTSVTQTSYGASVTLPEPTRSGYNFDGWNTAADGNGNNVSSPYIPTENITLFAKWTPWIVLLDEVEVIWSDETEFVYNGKVQNPTATATYKGLSIPLVITGATDAGTYTAVASLETPNEDFILTNTSVEFTINRAEGKGVVLMKDWREGSTRSNPQIFSETNGISGVIITYRSVEAYDYPETRIKPTSTGNYIVKATFPQVKNYNEVIAECEFTINSAQAKPLNVVWTNQTEFVYNKMVQAPVPSAKDEYGRNIPLVVINGQSAADKYEGAFSAIALISDELLRRDYYLENNTMDYEIVKKPLIAKFDAVDNTIFLYDGDYLTEEDILDYLNTNIKYDGFATDAEQNSDNESVFWGEPEISITEINFVQKNSGLRSEENEKTYLVEVDVSNMSADNYTLEYPTEFVVKLTDEPVSVHESAQSDKRFGIKFTQNPVSEKAEINIILPDNEKSAETKITIYDMIGNIVANGLSGDRKAPYVWDLRNKNGKFIANGTYLVVVEVKGQSGQVYRYSAKLGVKR